MLAVSEQHSAFYHQVFLQKQLSYLMSLTANNPWTAHIWQWNLHVSAQNYGYPPLDLMHLARYISVQTTGSRHINLAILSCVKCPWRETRGVKVFSMVEFCMHVCIFLLIWHFWCLLFLILQSCFLWNASIIRTHTAGCLFLNGVSHVYQSVRSNVKIPARLGTVVPFHIHMRNQIKTCDKLSLDFPSIRASCEAPAQRMRTHCTQP